MKLLTLTEVFVNQKRVNECEHIVKMAWKPGMCVPIHLPSSDRERYLWLLKYFKKVSMCLCELFLLRSLQFSVRVFSFFFLIITKATFWTKNLRPLAFYASMLTNSTIERKARNLKFKSQSEQKYFSWDIKKLITYRRGFLSMQTFWETSLRKPAGDSRTTCCTRSLVFKYSTNLFRKPTKCSAVRMLPGTTSKINTHIHMKRGIKRR
jgi:hypothetical protein